MGKGRPTVQVCVSLWAYDVIDLQKKDSDRGLRSWNVAYDYQVKNHTAMTNCYTPRYSDSVGYS